MIWDKACEIFSIHIFIQILKILEVELFGMGYTGRVLISASTYKEMPYFIRVAELAATSKFNSRITFSINKEYNDIQGVLKRTILPVNRRLTYGTGGSVCLPDPIKLETYKLAMINKLKGVVIMTYIWTFDHASSLEKASRYFDAVITDFPDTLHDVIQKEGIPLAKPEGQFKIATSNTPITSTKEYECDCDYSSNGCKLSKAPPAGFACKCSHKGAWSCSGDITHCKDATDTFCRHPDMSFHTCIQGAGNCDGYLGNDCGCDFSPGGCKVVTPAPSGSACRCSYEGLMSCSGYTTACKDPSSRHCAKPDTSAESCMQGGGDCGGYDTCDCNYGSGGCIIVKPARPNAACRCRYKGLWACGGEMVSCVNKDSHHCRSPDKSIQSCVEGNGDCGAYKDHCDCSYRSGGCVITKPPPSGTACKCKDVGVWTCKADQVPCRRYHDKYCQSPDTSKATCIFGGGECGGYQDSVV